MEFINSFFWRVFKIIESLSSLGVVVPVFWNLCHNMVFTNRNCKRIRLRIGIRTNSRI